MQNRDQPATAVRIDNGVDEPTQYDGLSKLEYAAIHIFCSYGAGGGPDSSLAAIRQAHDLFDKVGMTRGCLNEPPPPDPAPQVIRGGSYAGKEIPPPEEEATSDGRHPDND